MPVGSSEPSSANAALSASEEGEGEGEGEREWEGEWGEAKMEVVVVKEGANTFALWVVVEGVGVLAAKRAGGVSSLAALVASMPGAVRECVCARSSGTPC